MIVFLSFMMNAQGGKIDWKNLNKDERREKIEKMSPEERHQFWEELGLKMAINKLNITPEKQEAFSLLFKEYRDSKKVILDQFKPDFKENNLSDEDAKKRLNESFELAQQLLNHKKRYAEKFLKNLTPQQVLLLFDSEKKMREKMHGQKPTHPDEPMP